MSANTSREKIRSIGMIKEYLFSKQEIAYFRENYAWICFYWFDSSFVFCLVAACPVPLSTHFYQFGSKIWNHFVFDAIHRRSLSLSLFFSGTFSCLNSALSPFLPLFMYPIWILWRELTMGNTYTCIRSITIRITTSSSSSSRQEVKTVFNLLNAVMQCLKNTIGRRL